MKSTGFPMSLSLYQILFGVLVKENIINDKELSEITFYKPEAFFLIFPELRNKKFSE